MTITSAQRTDVGLARERNEDYVWSDEGAGVFVVADGLGGHQAGDVASKLAATTVGEMISAGLTESTKHPSAARKLMTHAIETTNQEVWSAAKEIGQDPHMASVVVVAVVLPPRAYISHAGDARAYLARRSTLTRLTDDDSVVGQAVAAGELPDSEARSHPLRHVVTKVVGQDSPVEPSFKEVSVQAEDWLILCSDGLWDMVDDERIAAELEAASGDPARASEALIRAANEAGGKDNISVIVIKIVAAGQGGDRW